MSNASLRRQAVAASAARQALEQSPQIALTEQPASFPARQTGRTPIRHAYRLDLSLLEGDPDQPRQYFDNAALHELADSIHERGIKQPISVRWHPESKRYRIIDGERRFRAAKIAGLKKAPCLIEDAGAADVLIDQIVANWQRRDLRPYETADALLKLKTEFSLSLADLARTTGKSKGEISKLIALVESVDADVQALVREVDDAMLTKRHLYALSQLDSKAQQQMAKRIQRDHLTAVETEAVIKSDRSLEPQRRPTRGRPRKSVRLKTSCGLVTLTPGADSYDTAMLLKMLHEARRQLTQEQN